MFTPVQQFFSNIGSFLDSGGTVLYWIMIALFGMWVLIIERFWYFRVGHPKQAANTLKAWEARTDHKSWYAHRVRESMISQVGQNLNRGIPLIKTFVALCPLIGLLGTVTGMAITGSGNARAMASGVSKATLPTMAGMVSAISGIFFATRLDRYAKARLEEVADSLTTED
jgi:biopolymer transport protein ExbB